jgi:hypothetical protein
MKTSKYRFYASYDKKGEITKIRKGNFSLKVGDIVPDIGHKKRFKSKVLKIEKNDRCYRVLLQSISKTIVPKGAQKHFRDMGFMVRIKSQVYRNKKRITT